MDDEYRFEFSLCKNDLIEIKTHDNKKSCFGYYNSFDIDSARLSILKHDSLKESTRVSIKTGVTMLNKYEVTVLGKKYKVKRG